MGLIDRIKRRLPILGLTPDVTPRAPVAAPAARPEPEPEPSSPRGDAPVRAWIEQRVAAAPVVLFMKGSPDHPQCGFSASAVEILRSYGDVAHVDVLLDPDVREDVKSLTSWPTIPQVFVGGEFVGGADILRELHANGELRGIISRARAS